jgi:hypothetical protein
MKTTNKGFIITSFFKFGLPVSNIFLRSIFNFNLELAQVMIE